MGRGERRSCYIADSRIFGKDWPSRDDEINRAFGIRTILPDAFDIELQKIGCPTDYKIAPKLTNQSK